MFRLTASMLSPALVGQASDPRLFPHAQILVLDFSNKTTLATFKISGDKYFNQRKLILVLALTTNESHPFQTLSWRFNLQQLFGLGLP